MSRFTIEELKFMPPLTLVKAWRMRAFSKIPVKKFGKTRFYLLPFYDHGDSKVAAQQWATDLRNMGFKVRVTADKDYWYHWVHSPDYPKSRSG